MRAGAHADELAPSLRDADAVIFLRKADLPWDAERVTGALKGRGSTAATVDELVGALRAGAKSGDHVVFMSNGGGNISIYHEQGDDKFELVQTVETNPGSKTMGLDTKSHNLFVPANFGGQFTVLVLGR